jgi:hypothetical protein
MPDRPDQLEEERPAEADYEDAGDVVGDDKRRIEVSASATIPISAMPPGE